MSLFLIRLLQNFAGFKLADNAQPVESRPPVEWSKYKGRQGVEKIWPTANATMFVKVGHGPLVREAYL